MKIQSIDSFKKGQFVKGFFYCTQKNLRETRLGDLYIDCLLKDATGNIRAKIWKNAIFFDQKFNTDNIVAIKGEVIEYNNNQELNIKFVNNISKGFYEEYGYTDDLIIGSIKEEVGEIINYINSQIKLLSKSYRSFISKIYKDNEKVISTIPINKKKYFLKGGLVKYIYVLLKLNERIHFSKNKLSSDRVVSCILIMLIGYLKFYNIENNFSKSIEAKSLNIEILGASILLSYFDSAKNLKIEDKIYLQQCISVNKDVTIYNELDNDKNIAYVKSLILLESLDII
jgi:uncharacterized protein YdeI (BOF family)